MNRRLSSRISALLLGVLLVVLSGTAMAAKGPSITVMVPPWGALPNSALQEFEKTTGIQVSMNIVGWDQIHDKVAIASVGRTAPADVIEVDWSWVGEFNAAGWFEPLNSRISADMRRDMAGLATFTAGKTTIAIPYSNDLRIGIYNKAHFAKAGIATPPVTWDQFVKDCEKIQATGVTKYAFGLPLSASESTTTSYILITLSRSGDLFDKDGRLNRANALATLKFLNDLVKVHKVVDPSMATMVDTEVTQSFLAGKQTFEMYAPQDLALAQDPAKSQIVGQAGAMLIPGRADQKTTTFGLLEGVGIPKYSNNKDAAWKFIQWYTSPQIERLFHSTQGLLPPRLSVMKELIAAGKIVGGNTLLDQAAALRPVFPGGTPAWYPQFSTTTSSLINQMIQGAVTPEQAVNGIEAKVNELRQAGK